MLASVRVKNIALIDEVTLSLEEGLNCITGETGAGKSILLGAISLALGARGAKDAARDPEKAAFAELLFTRLSPKVKALLEEACLTAEGDMLLLSRRILPGGRSSLFINDQQVTAAKVKTLASSLIDIHGQHELESLLDPSRHIELLDRFIPELSGVLRDLSQVLKEAEALEEERSKLLEQGKDRERLLSLMRFELSEIESANWQEGEEEKLKEERGVLLHSEKIRSAAVKASKLLGQGFEEDSAVGRLDAALASVEAVKELDPERLSPIAEGLFTALSSARDLAAEIRDYAEDMESDPERLSELEERVDALDYLKRKYGKDRESVFAYAEKTAGQIKKLEEMESELSRLSKELEEKKKVLHSLADRATSLRKEAAERIESEITRHLETMEFSDAAFHIELKKKDITRKGQDQVTFCVRTNVGEDMKNLSDIASGGEMSRIMLAIKTVLAKEDEIDTLIFDEIDAGISGRTAQRVAEKMSLIAGHHQVIAVTHLPQIAAMADTHLKIEKVTEDARASTKIFELSEKQMVEELSRLLGGQEITRAVRENAAEMKKMATEWKKDHA